ncbi:MAG: radical SAM protein [Clostridium sp.]|jgi:putative methyltransferase|nr:radical SAM protein [Clostridium sp.]
MIKRNVYMVQPDVLRSTAAFKTAYLPYAVGQLWTYAKQEPIVDDNYSLADLLFLRTDIEQTVRGLDNPFLVGFSCYVWNTEYNKTLAREIKETYPNCIIVFGGHNIPPDESFLEEFSYIDFLVHGEGEIPLQRLLVELTKAVPDLTGVPGLSYRSAEDKIITNAPAALPSLEDCPSPFLCGVFDDIYNKHPDIQWSSVWETNRGCPYQCAYCDWGLLKSKIRCFSMERLLAELEWFSEHKVEYIWLADSNFGFFERDEAIADEMIAAKKRSGYPMFMYANYAKHNEERVFSIVKKLNHSEISRHGTTLSFQSLSPVVLKNIGRTNMDFTHFKSLLERYRANGIMSYSELILGLPGESLESFYDGVETLLELGQHNAIVMYHCFLLPNSRLYARRGEFELKTVKSRLIQYLSASSEFVNEIPEYINTIISTKTLPVEDWKTASLFIWFVQGLHCYGVTRLVAIHLFASKLCSYKAFYQALLDYALNNNGTIMHDVAQVLNKKLSHISEGKDTLILSVPALGSYACEENQYVFEHAVYELAPFFDELEEFVLGFGMERELALELLRYQRELILQPNEPEKVLEFEYDFPSYFDALAQGKTAIPEKRHVRLRFFDPNNQKDWISYGFVVSLRGKYGGPAFYNVTEAE